MCFAHLVPVDREGRGDRSDIGVFAFRCIAYGHEIALESRIVCPRALDLENSGVVDN